MKNQDILINRPHKCLNCNKIEDDCNDNCEICNGLHFWVCNVKKSSVQINYKNKIGIGSEY